jgi:hypothetical protein
MQHGPSDLVLGVEVREGVASENFDEFCLRGARARGPEEVGCGGEAVGAEDFDVCAVEEEEAG